MCSPFWEAMKKINYTAFLCMHKHTEYLAEPQTRFSPTLLLYSFCSSKYVFVCFSVLSSCCYTPHSHNIKTTDSSLSILLGNLWFWNLWGRYLTQTSTTNALADQAWHWWGVFVVCTRSCWGGGTPAICCPEGIYFVEGNIWWVLWVKKTSTWNSPRFSENLAL